MVTDWTVTLICCGLIIATLVYYVYKVRQMDREEREQAQKEGRLPEAEKRRIARMQLNGTYGTRGYLKEGGQDNDR